jgi:hypothetical protein
MSYFYSNFAQEDTTNTKKKKKQMRVKNAIVLKKSPKKPQKPNFKKKSGYSGRLTDLLTANRRLTANRLADAVSEI